MMFDFTQSVWIVKHRYSILHHKMIVLEISNSFTHFLIFCRADQFDLRTESYVEVDENVVLMLLC